LKTTLGLELRSKKRKKKLFPRSFIKRKKSGRRSYASTEKDEDELRDAVGGESSNLGKKR